MSILPHEEPRPMSRTLRRPLTPWPAFVSPPNDEAEPKSEPH